MKRRTDPQPFVRVDAGCRGPEGTVEDETTRFVYDEEVQETHGDLLPSGVGSVGCRCCCSRAALNGEGDGIFEKCK